MEIKGTYKVIITDSDFPTAEVETEVLSQIGAEVQLFQCKTEEEVIKVARDADGIINNYVPITEKVISNLKKARIIVRYGIGYDNVNLKAASDKGIFVCNVPDYLTYEVADHTLSLILSLVRRIPEITNSTKTGEWDWMKFRPIYRLDGKTAGIIGFGHIGRQVAERLKAFKVKVISYSPHVQPELMQEEDVKPVNLKTLLKESDIISIHTSLTEGKKHLIGEEEFRLMKKTAILINTARGAIVDQKALYRALKEKWISGAALDVLEKEPPEPNDPLLKLDNVIITPHIGWYTEESAINLRKLAAEEVRRVLLGNKPKNLVNPE
ncbi:MAG: C-terminal binding protein, partial [Candidatus Jordarchaeaceae archaeon]